MMVILCNTYTTGVNEPGRSRLSDGLGVDGTLTSVSTLSQLGFGTTDLSGSMLVDDVVDRFNASIDLLRNNNKYSMINK
jgi:hypothetical protein